MSDERRRPRAFRLGPETTDATAPSGPAGPLPPRAVEPGTRVEIDEPVEPEAAVAVARELAGPREGFRWSRVLLSAVSGLLALAFGLWVDGLVRDLFARADALGWLGIAFLGAAIVAVLAIVGREVAGTLRLARIDRLRADVTLAAAADDEPAARRLAGELARLYENRPETARGRAALALHLREIVEGRDLLVLAEREILAPLDMAAQTLILDSAKRVSVVTAISPRAIVDILYVLVENLRLIRRLSDLYGGRPGTLGFIGFAGRVITHLGVTGSMAIGDTLVQQLVGQGLAARLSARLGEGVVNGLLTARIGLAALDLVRPMPHIGLPKPKLGDMLGELTTMPGGGTR
ncbi:YcjF family protein [Prosthecomicrobium sp. N25]|uniref:YcjF family protein n=1 Tax=Prosthecomicrobium sp. N25 TaxID=3129254 RepID=UPI00307709E9